MVSRRFGRQPFQRRLQKSFGPNCVMSLHMLHPTLGQDASMPKIFPKSIIHASLHLDIFWQRFAKDLQEIMQYDLCKYLLSDGIQTVILKEIFFKSSTWGGGDTPKLGRLEVSRFEKLQVVIFPVLFKFSSSKKRRLVLKRANFKKSIFLVFSVRKNESKFEL